MRRSICWGVLLAASLLATQLVGAAPAKQLIYRGRVAVNGTAFTGTGAFRFMLLDSHGKVLWSTGALAKETGIPVNEVRLPITDGIYTVTLGDTHLGMPPLPRKLLASTDAFKLRIWFDDGTHGPTLVGDDQDVFPLDVSTAAAPTAEDLRAILVELRQIHALLDKLTPQHTPFAATLVAQMSTTTVAFGQGHVLGNPDAPVTLVEFSDYQCPYCRQYFETIFPAIKTNFIDTGKVRFVSRNLPLTQIHPYAMQAAQAALCAGEQGKYWEMRSILYTHPLQPDNLMDYARQLGLDMAQFTTSLNSGKYLPDIQADMHDAVAAGVNGTPSFVLGKTAGADNVTGQLIVGAMPFDDFAEMINALAAK